MGQLEWDDRLMPRARAFNLAGTWRLRTIVTPTSTGDKTDVHLECMECDQKVAPINGYVLLDNIVAAVLRHQVMHHGQSLSATGGGDDESAFTPLAR